MSKCGKEILLAREGTGQMQRFLDALDPHSVELNDLGLEEWLKFAYHFAKHIHFFSVHNHKIPSGDWSGFFKSGSELETMLKNVNEGKTITPHLALFVSFIYLLGFTRNRFNQLTKKHLDFYYQRILQIEKLPAIPDKVHLIFELAKNSLPELIAENTALDGGKDAGGKKLIYKTTENLVLNRAKIASIKSVYNDISGQKLKAAPVAASFDGMGAVFPTDEMGWWPFGYSGDSRYPALPDARLGFAFSSEILEMKEGLRNVQLTIDFSAAVSTISVNELKENFEICCSGEKGWLGPFPVLDSVADEKSKVIFSSGLSSDKKILKLVFQIPAGEKAVTTYNPAIHGENFNTSLPVCRILVKMQNQAGYSLYQTLSEKKVANFTVNIDVRGVKSLTLTNDFGAINPLKPFYPFGTRPVRQSNFMVGCPEVFKKEWTKLNLDIEWKNTPVKTGSGKTDAFADLYFAYRTSFFNKTSASEYAAAIKTETNFIVGSKDHFQATLSVQGNEKTEAVNDKLKLFKTVGETVQTQISITNNDHKFAPDWNGQVQLSLNQHFYHELFQKIYALALVGNNPETIVPNEPYTPLAGSIRLSYSAEKLLVKKAGTETGNELNVFHLHPFGQTPEFSSQSAKTGTLLPAFSKGGELYIGIENVEPLQQVSLLVQVLEGSENPETEPFAEDEKMEWSALCNNHWTLLDTDFMISNPTDNFLKSGIVKFVMPAAATSENTLLPGRVHWIRAKIQKEYNAVCKVLQISAQSVLAEFSDAGNDLTHLEKGLPAQSVSKMVTRLSAVKSVSQPFNSFSGKPRETDAAWYRRVSERLRHKNRAITVWDYEHLILQQFPEIYKVKCLNHSKVEWKNNKTQYSFLSPGNVLIVVIPDIVSKNVFDIYQPRVSKATLNAVQRFVARLNSPQVNVAVINPEYEEVMVRLSVKFHKGYDENYYKNLLNSDITKLLSPWAFENAAGIRFGTALHRSSIIHSIEKLSYVDYVEDVKLIRGNEISTTQIVPSCPVAILVSAKMHDISFAEKTCSGTTQIHNI